MNATPVSRPGFCLIIPDIGEGFANLGILTSQSVAPVSRPAESVLFCPISQTKGDISVGMLFDTPGVEFHGN